MKRNFIWLLALMFLIPIGLQAQKVEKKFMKELCKCSEQLSPGDSYDELSRKITECINIAAKPYISDLVAQYEEDRAFKEFDAYIYYLMKETTKDCPKLMEYYLKLEWEQFNEEDRSGMKHDNPEECLTIHDGTFLYAGKDSAADVYITRKGNVQIEGSLDTDEYVLSEIEWLDECTYKCTYKEIHDPHSEGFIKEGESITVNITNVDGNYFSYFTIISGTKINGDMKKISDEFSDPREE